MDSAPIKRRVHGEFIVQDKELPEAASAGADAPSKKLGRRDRGGDRLTVHVPMRLRMIGGRKVVIAPEGSRDETSGQRANSPGARKVAASAQTLSPMVKALARAFRWRRLLESGEYPSIAALAAAEGIDKSYVSKILRLTLLEPITLQSVFNTTVGNERRLDQLLRPFPARWREQNAPIRRDHL